MSMTFPKKMNAMGKDIDPMNKWADAMGRRDDFRKIDTGTKRQYK
jgi:hypothetical protein